MPKDSQQNSQSAQYSANSRELAKVRNENNQLKGQNKVLETNIAVIKSHMEALEKLSPSVEPK